MSIIQTLETQMIGILDTVTALKKNLSYEPKALGPLPMSTLWFNGFEQEGVEARSTETTYKWVIRLYIDLSDGEKAQDLIKTLVPSVLSAFRTNLGLNDNCIYSIIEAGEIFAVLDRDNPMMMVEMDFSAKREEDF